MMPFRFRDGSDFVRKRHCLQKILERECFRYLFYVCVERPAVCVPQERLRLHTGQGRDPTFARYALLCREIHKN